MESTQITQNVQISNTIKILIYNKYYEPNIFKFNSLVLFYAVSRDLLGSSAFPKPYIRSGNKKQNYSVNPM